MHSSCRLLAALALLAPALALPARARVVVVGVDGACWSVLDPLLAEGRLPHLAALASRGVTADMDTVEPVISPVVWTSIATGRSPAAHGVTDFLKDARDLAVPTVFERLAVQGLRVGTYEWLVTWPPRGLPGGFVIPAWLRRDERTEPPDVFAGRGPGYRYALRGVVGRAAYAANARAELAAKAAQWNALAGAFALDVGSVTFYAVDAVSHRFWHDSFPGAFADGSAPPPDPAFAALVQEVVAGLDRAVGEIAAPLGPDDALLVVSDHGFEAEGRMRRIWSGHAELLLARAGLVPGRDAFTIEGEFAYGFLRVHAGPFAERDALLDRLVAFYAGATTESGEPLFTVEVFDQVERPAAARRPLAARARQWVLRQVLERWFSVRLDADAHAYVLVRPNDAALESAWPDGRVRVAGRTVALAELVDGDGFSGRHHPTALFLAAGGALRHVPQRGRLSVLDVAPLVAYLADAGIPDDLEGRLPEEWIEPGVLARRPPRRVAAEALPRLPAPDAADAPDAVLLERLRSMGYVE
jgi:hypothetical protein